MTQDQQKRHLVANRQHILHRASAGQKWAWPISQHSAIFRTMCTVHARILNVQCGSYWPKTVKGQQRTSGNLSDMVNQQCTKQQQNYLNTQLRVIITIENTVSPIHELNSTSFTRKRLNELVTEQSWKTFFCFSCSTKEVTSEWVFQQWMACWGVPLFPNLFSMVFQPD